MRVFIKPLTNDNVTLTAYLLDASNEMVNTRVRPAILIFPGGAYRSCSDREAEPVAMAFLAEGYHAFVLRYSVNQMDAYPKALADAEEALELIRYHSAEWNIDPGKIAVCGFSAGGHLASALGTMGRVRPNALILCYANTLFREAGISPMPIPGVTEHVDASTPPSFIFHTCADRVTPVRSALSFASALEAANVPFELHIFQQGEHGLSLAKPVTSGGARSMINDDAAKWFDHCIAWLKNIFGEFEARDEIMLNENIQEYGVDVQLGVLWKNPECRKLVVDFMPELGANDLLKDAMGIPLRKIFEFSGVPEPEIRSMNKRLKQIQLLK